jgi:hypothetical protein
MLMVLMMSVLIRSIATAQARAAASPASTVRFAAEVDGPAAAAMKTDGHFPPFGSTPDDCQIRQGSLAGAKPRIINAQQLPRDDLFVT